jgi:hypothetical protein
MCRRAVQPSCQSVIRELRGGNGSIEQRFTIECYDRTRPWDVGHFLVVRPRRSSCPGVVENNGDDDKRIDKHASESEF